MRKPIIRNLAAGVLAMTLLAGATAHAAPLEHEQRINLWPAKPVGTPPDLTEKVVERSKSLFRADRALMGIAEPSLTVFLPERPNGTSLIIAPGGSYQRVVLDKEGIEIAQALAAQGITAFLLAYRLPGEGHENAADAPLADGQRAVRLVRQHAQEWGLDSARVGFLGFSAAGHLGASLATGFDRKVYAPVDAADEISARPDFAALIYPVVTMQDDHVHEGSRTSLLGEAPGDAMKAEHSPQLHVTASTPETFILAADDDTAVPAENAVLFYSALRAAGVKSEIHIFRDGGHGFGIRGAGDLPAANWPALFADWLKQNDMLPAGDS